MQHLRKNRARPVGDVLLDDAGREGAVYIYIINTPFELGDDRGVGHAVDVEYRRLCQALAAEKSAFDLQRGVCDALSHEGGVGAQGLGEAVLAAFEGFLKRRLADAALDLRAAVFKAHGAPFVLENDSAAALRYIADYIVERRAQRRLRAVHRAVEKPLRRKCDSRAKNLGQGPQHVL